VPPRDPNLRLQDIAEAIDRIFDYTASHSLESFAADRKTIDAVVRNLEVIGEAARHTDAETAARLSDVPWQDMRDLRHLLVHLLRRQRGDHLGDDRSRSATCARGDPARARNKLTEARP